jgi:hypothetical protein
MSRTAGTLMLAAFTLMSHAPADGQERRGNGADAERDIAHVSNLGSERWWFPLAVGPPGDRRAARDVRRRGRGHRGRHRPVTAGVGPADYQALHAPPPQRPAFHAIMSSGRRCGRAVARRGRTRSRSRDTAVQDDGIAPACRGV